MANPTLYDNFSRVKDWAVEKFADKETLAATLSDVAFSGDYNDLKNKPDLSTYVTQTSLSGMSYVSQTALSGMSYVSQTALNGMSYVSQDALNGMSYASKSYVATYVADAIAQIPGVDLSAYVTKDFLSSQSYVTSTALESMAYATTAYVMEKVTGIIDGAPEALDTLNELAAAINDDANFASTITNEISKKANSSDVYTKTQIQNMSYVSQTALSGMSYVSQTALSGMGYLTAVPSEYITDSELSACGYLTAVPSEYITDSELSACGYVTPLTQNQMDALFPISNS